MLQAADALGRGEALAVRAQQQSARVHGHLLLSDLHPQDVPHVRQHGCGKGRLEEQKCLLIRLFII